MNAYQTAAKFLRAFPKFTNDYTFLSSIRSVDFENRIISVRTGYWKCMISFIRTEFPNLNGRDIGRLCGIIKSSFIERFAQCSASSVKNFFLGYIKRSYYDFSNIFYYVFDVKDSNIEKRLKKVAKLRKLRFFENKAKRHYMFYLECQNEVLTSDNETYTSDVQQEFSDELVELEDELGTVDNGPDLLDNFSDSSTEHYEAFIDDSIYYDDISSQESDDRVQPEYATYVAARQVHNRGDCSDEIFHVHQQRYYRSKVEFDRMVAEYGNMDIRPIVPTNHVHSVHHEPVIGEYGVVEGYHVITHDTIDGTSTSYVDVSDRANFAIEDIPSDSRFVDS